MDKINKALIFMIFLTLTVKGQESNHNPLEISVNYGVAGNFFVDYNQPNSDSSVGSQTYFNKAFIGTIGGFEVIWHLKNNKQSIGVNFDRQINYGKKNINYNSEGLNVKVVDFKLRHLNEMLGVFYKRKFKETFSAFIGFFILYPHQQELEISGNSLFLEERNNENSNLSEAGIFLGVDYYFFKSGNFELGIQSKLFHTTSIGEFEAISISPKLRYLF